METPLDPCLNALYHRTEDYYFDSTCPLHQQLNPCVNVYFVDEYFTDWNLMFIRVGTGQPGNALAACLEFIPMTTLPIRAVIHQDKVEAVQDALGALDFFAAERSTAMVLDLSTFTPTSATDRLLRIGQTDDLDRWAGPVGNAFQMPAEGVAHYQARHQVALDSGKFLYHFILSVQGQTVCALTLSMCDDLARLNDIGTHADHRGKGYATQLINAALAHAVVLGARWCFLEASAEGLSLYRRLGFLSLFEYQAFLRGALPAPVAAADAEHCGDRVAG